MGVMQLDISVIALLLCRLPNYDKQQIKNLQEKFGDWKPDNLYIKPLFHDSTIILKNHFSLLARIRGSMLGLENHTTYEI